MVALALSEARRRAAATRLVLTDCDGVLTDGGVYYSDQGEAMKRFSIRDGKGVERLRAGGIETGIVTGERSGSVSRRAEKLGLQRVYLGATDKAALLPRILQEARVSIEEVACIGDDVNDLAILTAIGERGLTGAPFDAMPEVLRIAHHRASAPGGHGAFRDFAEWILELRG